MSHLAIRDIAILVGFTGEGICCYSEQCALGDYWDGEHVWDDTATIIRLGLARLSGFLFESDGELMQQFESNFDPSTGEFQSGWARNADGSVVHHEL